METPLQAPRGTRDILPENQPAWSLAVSTAERIARQFGFSPITVPSYEDVRLFQRSLGEGTDVIDKELFLVRGVQGEADAAPYALRPEGTAGIVRSYIQHGLHTRPQPVKVFSILSLFRYDRPQKGRYREHVQFDLEYFGDTGPFADAWVIYTTYTFYRSLGLQNLKLKLNSLGTADERAAYRQKLTDYLQPLADQLSQDSKRRLTTNPLRVLDSKDRGDAAVTAHAPHLWESLGPESRQHIDSVCRFLDNWHIPYFIDHFLVRGLDYYCHTAFEWVVEGKEGQQSSLGGGGRYDGLLTQLGGASVGAVGAGLGLDRVIEEMEAQNVPIDPFPPAHCYVATAGSDTHAFAQEIISTLLSSGCTVEANFSRTNLGNHLKQAHRLGIAKVILVGSDEAARRILAVKDLSTGEQTNYSYPDQVEELVSQMML
jgi:histidyl-tRNA synthetase